MLLQTESKIVIFDPAKNQGGSPKTNTCVGKQHL